MSGRFYIIIIIIIILRETFLTKF